MTKPAYYNETHPYAARWLRNLISAGHIAPGDVDERSIEDVRPDDLRSYVQCHFFAGIGVWSYALRRAGVADSARVWTGSCPCQPFSAAGKGNGFADERHLWPAWLHLISQCRPAAVLGEQVASKDADPWIDLVQDDLEALGYAVGAVPFPSAGVGAPHIRDRLYWVATAANGGRREELPHAGRRTGGNRAQGLAAGFVHGGRARRLALAEHGGCQAGQPQRARPSAALPSGADGGLADTILQQRQDGQPGFGAEHDAGGRLEGAAAAAGLRGDLQPGPVNGLWSAADWLLCRDGKWRPVEPGTFPLAHGAPARVGRLRAYGNALNAEAATQFVRAAL